MSSVKREIEALLFLTHQPLDITDLQKVLEVDPLLITEAIVQIQEEYQNRGVYLHEEKGKYQFRTHPVCQSAVSKFLKKKERFLSKSHLEVLSIIAYRQPITRSEIQDIRGADSNRIISFLKEEGLIEVAGVRETLGQPIEFRTSRRFLDVFGLKSLKDLPTLRHLEVPIHERQEFQDLIGHIRHRESQTLSNH